MHWIAYVFGMFVGVVTGFWFYDFWEDFTGVGAPNPPSFDFYVPLALFIVATVLVGVLGSKAGPRDEVAAEK